MIWKSRHVILAASLLLFALSSSANADPSVAFVVPQGTVIAAPGQEPYILEEKRVILTLDQAQGCVACFDAHQSLTEDLAVCAGSAAKLAEKKPSKWPWYVGAGALLVAGVAVGYATTR